VVVSNPKLITQLGPAADLNRARYTRYHWIDDPAPDAILILVPGFEGGAGDFKILAENLLVRARARNDQIVELWGFDRRTNQLEDTLGLDIAEDLLDPVVALDWLFGAELGLPLHPVLSSGPARRAVFYNTSNDIPFLANWTPLVFSRDIDAVVAAAHAAVGNGNVFLGGHSAGTGFTARYAATDFDLIGGGPADPGYAKLRGLVLLEGGGGSTGGTPPSSDTLDRIEAKFDGGLFGAVRDQAPRCVDGLTACTVATEAADCATFTNTKCTPNVSAYSVFSGLLNPKILAAVEPAALQGVSDPDGGQILLQVDFGSGTAISAVPELATLAALPQATVFGGIGAFIDDDGAIASLASFVSTSVGAAIPGPPLQTWQDVTEGAPPAAAVPNNGPAPTTPPTPPANAIWGQEKEVTDFSRMLGTFYAGGTNFTDWYYPSAGLSVTSGLPSLDSSALSLDPPSGRGRRDIKNLTQAAAIDIPVIAFGGSNGLAEIPADFLAFAQSIAPCAAPSCDGSTPRVVDPSLPNTAFPTYGDVDGGFEVHMNEGFAHVDVLTAEDNTDNNVVAPLAEFLLRNSQ
jgi:pimeloyl-ACP methyl ester carboxylesterase